MDLTERREEASRAWQRLEERHGVTGAALLSSETGGTRHMMLLKAIVRPEKVDAVREAVTALGLPGLTVTEVRGHGKQKGHTATYRGQEYAVTLLPKMEIEVVVPDEVADQLASAIMEAAKTGTIGDGRVFVIPVERSYRIRTGEANPL